jgi:type III pantothenate kinase
MTALTLLIDSGNSRLKAAWLDPRKPGGRRESAIAAFDNQAPDALAAWLRAQPVQPGQTVGVNVAGAERGEAIAQALRQACGCAVRWLRAEPRTLMLANGYVQPGQLGADRWAAMLGVAAGLPDPHPPFIVASFGTATTIDVVDSGNVFAGGVILPGPAMMRASLAAGTADLPLAEGGSVVFPTDTHQAIATGIAAAQAGAVARQWLAAREREGKTPLLYVTGGGWPLVAAETGRLLAQAGEAAHPLHVDSPVLDGLAAWAMASQAAAG